MTDNSPNYVPLNIDEAQDLERRLQKDQNEILNLLIGNPNLHTNQALNELYLKFNKTCIDMKTQISKKEHEIQEMYKTLQESQKIYDQTHLQFIETFRKYESVEDQLDQSTKEKFLDTIRKSKSFQTELITHIEEYKTTLIKIERDFITFRKEKLKAFQQLREKILRI